VWTRWGTNATPVSMFRSMPAIELMKGIDWERFNAAAAWPGLQSKGLRERSKSESRLEFGWGEERSSGYQWAQKKIHGAAASAAERCDICEKILLPECRSWREHRPVYGPSNDISLIMSAQRGGACQKQHVRTPSPAREHDGEPPATAGCALVSNKCNPCADHFQIMNDSISAGKS
jgi:hypothetical protein